MSLENFKITDEQISESGVVSAPDKLTGNAAENKAVFDNLVRAVVARSINNLISLLTSPEAASVLGAKWPEGESANSLQEALDAAVINSDAALKKAMEALDAANAAAGVDLSNYIKKTDEPAYDIPSLIRVRNSGSGITIKNGYFTISPAQEGHIEEKTDAARAITPSKLDYAVKIGVTTNTEVLTDDEKASALAWLGAPSIATRTYVGAGGIPTSENPVRVDCPFEPSTVVVFLESSADPTFLIMNCNGGTAIYYSSTNSSECKIKHANGFSYANGYVSWYGGDVWIACNLSQKTYSCLLIK